MTPERWMRVKEVFHAAVEHRPAGRAAFLSAACGEDAALRAEVERLVRAHEQAATFIDKPLVAPGATAAVTTGSVLTGEVIGRYKIGRLVGVGGMGEVYAATDVELGREVAIKVGIVRDLEAHPRLKREAQHASRLNHPNICTIHEVGRHDDQPFIVMELVEGEVLSQIIPAGGLPADDVVRYGIQLADALAHAHGVGVLHRDLKSANVRITRDGRPKVLDFGLARALSRETLDDMSQSRASITREGVVAGTLSVMAPEMLRGEPADERADIWSLGVLLYEIASGEKPFRGATGFELSGAILHSPAAPLAERVPDALARIIYRCLEKDPRDRYQTAGEVRAALSSPQSRPVQHRFRVPNVGWKFRLGLAAAAVLLLVASYGVFVRRDTGPTATGASGRPAVAVMHFENAGATDTETAWLSSGIPSMLTTGLAQTRGLEVVSLRRLQQALRQGSETSLASLDRTQAADVARRAGAGAIVVGSIFRSGDEIRIDAQVEDLASGRVLAAKSVRGNDVFTLVDELSAGIREVVGFTDAQGVRNVAAVSSTSLEAYRLYSEGMEAFGNARWPDAEKAFKAAVDIDSSFAEVYLRLATVAGARNHPAARTEYLRLSSLHADRLNEPLRLLLEVQLARDRGDGAVVTRLLDELLEKFPDTEEAYTLALNVYRPNVGALQNRTKRLAIAAAGVAALPRSTHTRNAYGYALLEDGRYSEAIVQFETYASLAPREANPLDSLAEAYLNTGDAEKAVEAYSRAMTIDPTFPSGNSRALCLAVLGRYDDVVIEHVEWLHQKAMILSRLGRYREALRALADGEKEARADGDRSREASMRLVVALLALERHNPEQALRETRSVEALLATLPDNLEQRVRVVTELIAGLADLQARRQAQALAHFEAQGRAYSSSTAFERTWRHSLEGELALARGDLPGAATAFSAAEPRFRSSDWTVPLMSVLVNQLPSRDGPARVALARGDLDGAIRMYRELLVYGPQSKWIAAMEPRYVLQIARLLEKKGDGKAALDEYQCFLRLWKNADADLPELAEARRAVKRLEATS